MRSSIACSRCRRSKIKCVNSGIDTTCRACESSGRECVYPTPAIGAGGGIKRDLASTGDGDDRNGDWDGPKRQRSRKSMMTVHSASKDVTRPSGPVLDSAILTPKVWESLFELFQVHFSTILPFLHPTTFLAQIRQLNASTAPSDGQLTGDHSSPVPRTEASPLILLGVLVLTARFHPQLVQYHSPQSPATPSNPLFASEFYATALRARLAGVDGADLASTDISRVQALLMLSLHEWGMCRGKSAWIYVGMAVRLSQAMGMSFEPENERPSQRNPSPGAFKADPELRGRRDENSDEVIEQETKRRTFWSCFMLDRCLSGGKYRPRMIKVNDMGIQLPSDNAFAFGERVRTSRLSDGQSRRSPKFDNRPIQIPSVRQSMVYADDAKLRSNGPSDLKQWSTASHRSDGVDNGIDRWEVGAEECVLSRLIRIIRIWGSIAKWSCGGGRKADQYPPWHPESQFSHLRDLLNEFQEGLSRNLQYSQRNTDTHIMYKNTLAPYSLMHIIYFLSVIVLHRAYLPFLPIQYTEPQGPSDELSFPLEKYNVPNGYWRDSARELFKSARHMIELTKACQDRGVLIETPLVGFAVYNATLVGIYAAHFNHMDQEGYMCSKPNSTDVVPGLGGQGQVEVRRGIEILGDMRPRLKMAVGWFRTIHRLHSYFTRATKGLRRGSRKLDMGVENGFRPANGVFGPYDASFPVEKDEFRLLDKILADFGSAEDHVSSEINGNATEEEPTNGVPVSVSDRGPASDTASNPVKSEGGEGLDSHPDRRESWVPVNSPGNPPGAPSSNPDADRSDLSTVSRTTHPPETERWPLPPPPTYPLPPISSHPTLSSAASTTSPNQPPALTSPNSYASSTPPASTASQYLQAPSSNRLQPLQPWITSRQPPPPPYSQSLPPIATAAHHGFPMPPLSSSTFHLTPPRPDPSIRSLPSTTSIYSLDGDDVLAFVEGGSYESWATSQSGWLSTVWAEHRQ